ncbi:MAG TPA: response regulator transcription factor [Solirubrobacteraceae bacterium]|nr:response regulator transcription factor [Solirubrobacteraceae bacterium]
MIRILIVDDHPALRAGLNAVLEAEPGFVVVGAADKVEQLFPLLHRTRPDVVLLDYHLPPDDGLRLCRRIKRQIPPPRVLVYSAYADARMRLPALLAGADGLLNKGAGARELFETIRLVAGGRRALGPIGREQLAAAAELVDGDAAPIIAMLMDDTPVPEIAKVLGVPAVAVERRLDRMLDRLRVETPAEPIA